MSCSEACIKQNKQEVEELIACHQCDLLVTLSALEEGEQARCPRCDYLLRASPRRGSVGLLSLTVACLGLFVLSNLFPFMSFSGAGMEQVTTLFGCCRELYNHGSFLLALLVFLMIIALPGLFLLLLLFLLIPLLIGRKRKGFKRLVWFVFVLRNWVMVDVFLFGVLVSLTKIASLAEVELGLSFAFYVSFSLVFSRLVSVLDKGWIWGEWEALSNT